MGIVWFRKHADGSFQVLHGYVNAGQRLDHYARLVRANGIGPGSIDYVRSDAELTELYSGVSRFEAMRALGLNPEVLPAAQWRSPQPFAAAA